ELVFNASLELPLVVAEREIVGSRGRGAAARIPGGVISVEPVEHVEDLEIEGEFVTPRRLESLGNAQVEPLVANRLLGKEHAAEIAVAACAIGRRRAAIPRSVDVAERRPA